MSAMNPPHPQLPTSAAHCPSWTCWVDQTAWPGVGEGAGKAKGWSLDHRTRSFGALLFIALTRCSLQDPTHWFSPEGASSYLIVQVGSAGVTVEAEAGPLVRSYEAEDLRQLYLLGYAEDLAELGLEPGLLQVDQGGGVLPKPRWIQAMDRTLQPEGGFQEVAELPRSIAELRFAAIDACPTLVPEVVPLGEAGLYFFFFISLDPKRALLGTNRDLFLVESDAVRKVALPGNEGRVYTAAWAPRADELWLASSDGVIFRGNLQDGLQEATRAPRPLEFGALSGRLDPTGTELYTATSSSSVAWWRQGQWTTVSVALDSTEPIAVEPLDDGGFVVGRRTASTVFQIQGEVPFAEVVDLRLAASDQIRSMQVVEGLGATIGTHLGDLYAYQAGQWSRVARLNVPTGITVAVPAFGGLFMGGEKVVFGLSFGDERECNPTGYSVGDNHDVKQAVRVGDQVYLTQEAVNETGSYLLRIRRR
jgi:hypothetical protein